MPYCHKRYYIAKGKCASVTKICSFTLMVIAFTWHVSSHALAVHHTKHSLSLPHRCCVHYITLVALMLFVHHYANSFMLCLYHRFIHLLYSLLRSYFERSLGILCFYSVFFTMPCIFWHYPRHRKPCCILYNNSLILSSLTANLMCYLLQHHLRPLSSPITQQKHRVSASSRSKLAKIVATLRCFYHISRMLQPEHHTAQKYTAFRGVYVLSLLSPLTFARQRDESGSHELSGHYFLRSRYSPLAVSTEITSPVLIKAGTFTTRPVSSVASLSTLLVVSPFTTSSV